MKKKKLYTLLLSIMLILCMLCGCTSEPQPKNEDTKISDKISAVETAEDVVNGLQNFTTTDPETEENTNTAFDPKSIPAYNGSPYIEVNDNMPFFTPGEIEGITTSWENYSELDEYNRPQTAYAALSVDTMPAPDEKRGEIGQIKPAGWHTVKYPDVIPDLYLYNRCHLIGWQLCAENDNVLNLITGTRYLNVEGMLPFENMVADYIKDTGNIVLYRVTPCYTGKNLIADGVLIEAMSISDEDCVFCVYCYNVQPGIEIDYTTGESHELNVEITPNEEFDNDFDKKEEIKDGSKTSDDISEASENSYVINTNTQKIHKHTCKSVSDISDENKKYYDGDPEALIEKGYTYCKNCF